MGMKKHTTSHLVFLFILIFFTVLSAGYGKTEDPGQTTEVSKNLYCISGYGGNIAVVVTEKGLLIVDAGLPNTATLVAAKIKQISDKPAIKMINTHYHADHTGGNVANPQIGGGAELICHARCLESLKGRMKPEEIVKANLSATTYDRNLSIQLGGDNVELIHFGPGHTSGDTVVVFKTQKAIHTGDLFFNGMAPYIDVKDGSNTGNWVETIRKLASEYPDYTVIPGHGPVADMTAFLKFAEYLTYLREKVAAAIHQGKSKSEAQETIDLTPFQHIKEHNRFMTKKANIGWIYEEMEADGRKN
jgi:glyoxylase-like metal-dependent hydrolase (beta-lactamase superfamily II)